MHHHRTQATILATLLIALFSASARAEGVYLTTEGILKDFFKNSDHVGYVDVNTAHAATTLQAGLGYVPRKPHYTVFVGRTGERLDGYAVIDEEMGQHLPIRFAVLMSAAGQVERTEVMAYSEAYGEEIREKRFREQFVGQRAGTPMRLGDEVVAISGATISSRAMVIAVRRALALVDWVRQSHSS